MSANPRRPLSSWTQALDIEAVEVTFNIHTTYITNFIVKVAILAIAILS